MKTKGTPYNFIDDITIFIFNKIITVESPNVNQSYSCYDLKVLIKHLNPHTDDENLEEIIEHIYDECEFIERGEWKICDCWIENIFCYCKKPFMDVIEQIVEDIEVIKETQTKLF